MNLNGLKDQLNRLGGLRRALTYVWESSPSLTVVSAFVLLIQGLLPVLSLYMMKLMLDAVSNALANPGDQDAASKVLVIIAIAAGVYLFSYIFQILGGLITSIQGRKVMDHMNDILHTKSSRVDLEYYENAKYYDALHRAQNEAAYRPMTIVNGLMDVLQNTISLLGVVSLLISFHWSVGLILFAAVLPSIAVRLGFSNKLYNLQRKYTPEERRSWYFHWMLTSVDFAKEIRMFNLGNIFIDRYQELRKRLRKVRQDVDVQRSGFDIAAQVVAAVAVYGAYAWIAMRTIQGNNTLGDLVMFYQAFQRGQGFLASLLGGLAGLYENNLFLSNLYEFLDLEQNIKVLDHPLKIPEPMQQGIQFEHVEFQYPGGVRKVIRDVSLSIKPGKVIALVGENGSGKTTLVKLLCRLYDPIAGKISIDGIDLKDMDLNCLRQAVSVIFQDYAHYNLTARENIWFGNVGHSIQDEKIIQAAQRSGADEFINKLEKRYDTVLGKMFENGEELSIGEWQKVALARAFLRDSQVIVLDEPTSAMDPKAEYEVFMKFRELLDGKTAILISHRLSTVRMADHIYVLQDGVIAEEGTHEGLLAQRGIYASLFEKQAGPYR